MASVPVNIRMPEDMTDWIDAKVRAGHFADRSNAIRFIIADYMAHQEGPKTQVLQDGVVVAEVTYYGDAELVSLNVL